MRTLFIGGVGDGQMIKTESHHAVFQLPVWPSDENQMQFTRVLGVTDKIKTHMYRRVRLTDSDHHEYHVFIWEELNLCALAALINGYTKQPNP